MKKNKTRITTLIIVCIGLCLCIYAIAAQVHTVRFFVGDTLYSQQRVTTKECPAEVTVEEAGLVFRGWQNSAGEIVDVPATVITRKTNYYAVIHPVLDRHVPYLFANELGMVRPNDALTCDELASALNALAGEEAKKHFPQMPAGSEAISRENVRSTLTAFFLSREVDNALPASDAGQVSRGEFAVAMNLLLQRCNAEQTVTANETKLPVDLFRGQAGVYDMLEAVMPHELGAEGETWQSVALPESRPTFLNIDGWLYYLQENGQLLMDGDVGTLHFDSNGRYTCGDAELDTQVAQIISRLMAENPGMDKLQLLRQCQIYCRDTFQYLRRDPYEFGATGWEIEDAKNMLAKGRGNCYSFAGVFWALARGLGYEAYAISGTCLKDEQPHSWVMIEFDGEEFFFDPQWEWAYHNRGVYDKEMFMLSLKSARNWGYKWTPHW